MTTTATTPLMKTERVRRVMHSIAGDTPFRLDKMAALPIWTDEERRIVHSVAGIWCVCTKTDPRVYVFHSAQQ